MIKIEKDGYKYKCQCASNLSITAPGETNKAPAQFLARNSDVIAQRRCTDARRLGKRGAKVYCTLKRQGADNKNNTCGRMRPAKDTLALSGSG
ncbi:hypothetical protein PBY51_006120 [Eleginops maclovinus]|uniref:Uncharacterized protein n=1 Tax=Eleginops maclovinus TaxID=56733 RepID=A0AAN7WTE5_ELEMC|nr:hypothetical protein PBY51_006120 [Eleginops maclovinus]